MAMTVLSNLMRAALKFSTPVLGQTKECQRLRCFLPRGLANENGQWALWSTTHNILKLLQFRAALAGSLMPSLLRLLPMFHWCRRRRAADRRAHQLTESCCSLALTVSGNRLQEDRRHQWASCCHGRLETAGLPSNGSRAITLAMSAALMIDASSVCIPPVHGPRMHDSLELQLWVLPDSQMSANGANPLRRS
ncbi:hypothetical protein KQ313_11935 [Synechococcus sp. CS-1325]|uniref:hypothetical protein n=1 Tax=Synechococcus sp. CS-1325 TaxID=2847979 RepID=UPI000DB2D79E|nr:hypothetical protein [Synechococcus sp. CS-1325]MCT0200386.1 hypothetical protein [Synechococcus sp. CS-1325]PZU96885.1 MAG: hypothetical protein DCF24_13370 [Cyanobium sp.]